MLPVAVPRSRSHRRRWFTVTLASGLTLAICLWTLAAWHRTAQARRAARSEQRLLGFTESRQADLPTDLRGLNVSELLAHPLLAHPTPTCALTPLHQARYAPLLPSYRPPRRQEAVHATSRNDLTYLVALNLFSSSTVLPSLIRALVALLTSLGPTRFHISIYENGSTDTTPTQLYLFAQILRQLGAGFTLHSDPARPAGFPEGSRIDTLAELRNLALRPLFDAPEGTYDRVLFVNDVQLCEADMLEMMLQHEVQEADMSCGMDYKELRIKEFEAQGYPLDFYDVWVARDMLGLPFYRINQPGGGWDLPSLPLPHSPSRHRAHSLLPIQVYSCFNGLTVLSSALFLPPHSLRFRAQDHGDTQSECFLLCRDIWSALTPRKGEGRGARIQVVPRASVGYEVGEYERGRQDRNTTAWEGGEDGRKAMEKSEMVEWQLWPPKLVASYPYARWAEEVWIPPF